jgi:aspartate aminotransferase-like enzyme
MDKQEIKGAGLSWGTMIGRDATVMNRIDRHNQTQDAVRRLASARGLETMPNRPITSILIGRTYSQK